MYPDPLTALPSWLASGLALGVVASVVVAAVFALGERYIPDPERTGRRVSGTERRRDEVRSFFQAADEQFIEDHKLGATVVAFYLPERNVAVTFDPRVYLRLADGETFVILCEYEMPVASLGRRLPFDIGMGTNAGNRANTANGAKGGTTSAWRSPRAGSVDSAFDFLGLGRDADEDEVQSAYREQVKQLHPDQGGSQEAFQELQEAYATAKEHAN